MKSLIFTTSNSKSITNISQSTSTQGLEGNGVNVNPYSKEMTFALD
jgi:hypothetical protein